MFLEVKGALEGLYSLHNKTKDADLLETDKLNIQAQMDRADTAITNYIGALKGMKITVEPCQHAIFHNQSGSLDLVILV